MADKRSDVLTATLSDVLALGFQTWAQWPGAAPIELPQVPGETNSIGYAVKGTVSTDAAETIKIKFVVSYDNGSTLDTTTHESGLLTLDNGRFHHQTSLAVTSASAGDGKLIFHTEIWRDSANGTNFDVLSGRAEITSVRQSTGGTVYYAADGILPIGTILQIGDIMFFTDDELIQRWDGTQWVTIVDYSPLAAPDDVRSNKVGFY